MKMDENIKLLPVEVKCYSGYKADEYPVSFHLNDMQFEVKEVIDRWYHADPNPRVQIAEYFKVRTTDEKQFILKHEKKQRNWFLWIKGESLNLFL